MTRSETPPLKQLGRYEIVRELGKGAMGIVYLGRDPVIDRTVAIKTVPFEELPDDQLEEQRARFQRETKAVGSLNHPNIVTIHDAGEDPETRTWYMAMEFIEGENLDSLLVPNQPFPYDQSVTLITQIGAALDYAHPRGVIHRDVKPGNIILARDGSVKLTDFGIARLDQNELTRTGQILGTPNYMAPEQLRGLSLDHRVDIFSLGVILYRLWTGKRPFRGDTAEAVSYQIVHEAPIPPSHLNPMLPEGCDDVMARLLAKKPERRYQSCAELVADLLKIADNPPPEQAPVAEVTVPPVSPPDVDPSEATRTSTKTIEGRPPTPAPAAVGDSTGPRSHEGLGAGLLGALVVAAVISGVIWLVSERPPTEPTRIPVEEPGQAQPPDDTSPQVALVGEALEQQKEHLRKGREALESGDLDAATFQLQKVLETSPDHAEATTLMDQVRAARTALAPPSTPIPTGPGTPSTLLFENEYPTGSIRVEVEGGPTLLDVALTLDPGRDSKQVVAPFTLPDDATRIEVTLSVPDRDLDISETIEPPEGDPSELALLVKKRTLFKDRLVLAWK